MTFSTSDSRPIPVSYTHLDVYKRQLLLSQSQDTDRYYDPGYGYDYGYGPGRWVRIDDFLYLFFRILDMNQRYTFKIYFDRWYDDYYYRPDRFRDYHYRYYREAMRDWDRRLHLSEKQRRDMERYYDCLLYTSRCV